MLIAHLADTHLGRRQYGLEWREEDFYTVFNYTIDECLKEHVDVILISGDMFDVPRPPNRALKIARDAVKKAVDKGIKVYSILGEHDTPKTRDYPPQVLIPEIRILGINNFIDRIMVDGVEYSIAGIIHHPPTKQGLEILRRKIHKISRDVGKRSVLMLHQTIVNFFKIENGLEIHEIPENFTYVALGHIHRRASYRRTNGQIVAYAGSLEITSIDEIDDWMRDGKGFYLIDISGDEPSIQPRDTPVTPQIKLDLTYPKHKIELTKAIPEIMKHAFHGKLILHITITMPRKIEVVPENDIRNILVEKLAKVEKLHIRWRRIYTDDDEPKGLENLLEQEDLTSIEKEIIASLLAGSNNIKDEHRRLAELIVDLKNILSGAKQGAVTDIVEEIVRNPYWLRIIRLPEPKTITLSRTKNTGSKTSKDTPTYKTAGSSSSTRPRRIDEFLRGAK